MLDTRLANSLSTSWPQARPVAARDALSVQGSTLLRRGSEGGEVSRLQQQLNLSGANIGVDGKFGSQTDAALRSFQRSHGLTADGIVGPATRAALSQSAGPGARPELAHTAPRVGESAPSGTVRLRDITPPPTAPNSGNARNGTATFDRVTHAGRMNQMVEGRITVNGHSYNFRSGGWGRGSLPAGEYQVTHGLRSTNTRGMNVDGVGFTFGLSNKYDSRVGDTRSALLIHPDGNVPGTMGCIGIVGNADVQRRFRDDMLAELQRNRGTFTLRVGM